MLWNSKTRLAVYLWFYLLIFLFLSLCVCCQMYECVENGCVSIDVYAWALLSSSPPIVQGACYILDISGLLIGWVIIQSLGKVICGFFGFSGGWRAPGQGGVCAVGLVKTLPAYVVPRVPSFRPGWECAHPDHLLLAPHAVGLRRWPFALLPWGQDRGYPQDCWPFGLFYLGYSVYLCCLWLHAWIGGVVTASGLINWYNKL